MAPYLPYSPSNPDGYGGPNSGAKLQDSGVDMNGTPIGIQPGQSDLDYTNMRQGTNLTPDQFRQSFQQGGSNYNSGINGGKMNPMLMQLLQRAPQFSKGGNPGFQERVPMPDTGMPQIAPMPMPQPRVYNSSGSDMPQVGAMAPQPWQSGIGEGAGFGWGVPSLTSGIGSAGAAMSPPTTPSQAPESPDGTTSTTGSIAGNMGGAVSGGMSSDFLKQLLARGSGAVATGDGGAATGAASGMFSSLF